MGHLFSPQHIICVRDTTGTLSPKDSHVNVVYAPDQKDVRKAKISFLKQLFDDIQYVVITMAFVSFRYVDIF